ncbi:50S ribosomal protein L31 [Kosmotoga pacifica]|uniref:Large ribosomal subunit protein bL31 n=1 Tax=Kosmotoga pacifica TaxID=1330330 RepID=A0A0G2ZD94_9BACT|nr:50S ribosomal protein L31 [Kosmotoga pacifica]AKI98041.1 50S ribosomal protein L31 [Kosmotoga pacifica]
MKKAIHPELKLVTVKCTCGAEHMFWSTREDIKIDLCSNCHPFYKGDTSSLIVDTEGRVQKFKNKYGDNY